MGVTVARLGNDYPSSPIQKPAGLLSHYQWSHALWVVLAPYAQLMFSKLCVHCFRVTSQLLERFSSSKSMWVWCLPRVGDPGCPYTDLRSRTWNECFLLLLFSLQKMLWRILEHTRVISCSFWPWWLVSPSWFFLILFFPLVSRAETSIHFIPSAVSRVTMAPGCMGDI